MRRLPTIGLTAGLAAITLLTGCSSTGDATDATDGGAEGMPDKLVFAQIPSEDAGSIAEANAGIIAMIEAETGLPVELQEATSYAAVIEGLRAGQIQIAGMGPFSYKIAKDSGAGVEPLGALVDSPDEEPGYQSYAIVPAGSDITSLADFAGKTICFVDPGSTSGYLYPSAGLLDAGLDPETDITAVFAGGHDASVLSVANGTCDAGFAYDDMVDRQLIEAGEIEEGDVEVIWKSEIIAGSPYVVSDKLPADLVEEIKTIFAEKLNVDAMVEAGVCDSAANCPLPEGVEWGFIPVEDSLYDGVRKVCELTNADACNV